LQDEINRLRAEAKTEAPERIRNEVEFKSNRGYKSIHTRMRERVLINQAKHKPYPITEEEQDYEKVEVE
jgi:hypothetical protein